MNYGFCIPGVTGWDPPLEAGPGVAPLLVFIWPLS